MDFLARLFDTSDFPARWHCGNWTPAHGWLHVLSDLGVWSAYFAIPLVLGYFVARRRDLPFRTVFLLFGAFILLCGTTHLMEAVIFWWPAYRLAGAIKLLTAVASWATVVALVRVAPTALAMRTPDELEREVAARQEAERRLHEANAELERRVEQRTAELTAANALLRESEGRFRRLSDSGVVGIAYPDKHGAYLDGNDEFLRIVGYTRDDLRAGRVRWTDMTPAQHTPLDEQGVAEAAVRGFCTPYEKEYVRKDGTRVPILIGYALLEGSDDRYVAFVLDLTARKEAERKLGESEGRYRTLFENMAEEVHYWRLERDAGGRIATWRLVDANPPALKTWGRRLEDVAGRTTDEIFGPGSTDHYRAVVERVTATGTPHSFEDYFPHLDRHFRFTTVPLGDHFVTTGSDITALRKAHDALREAEERFRMMADNIPQLAWMARPDGDIFWYNRRWYEYTGTTLDGMRGWGWQSVHDPDVLPQVVERWKASLATGEPFDMVFPLKGADGTFRPFLTRVAPLKDDTGRVVYWFGTNTDISERQEAERRLREQEERLRLAVEATGVGIFDYDARTGRQVFSEQALRVWGLPPGTDPRPEVVLAAVHPDDRGWVESATKGSLDPSGSGHFSIQHRVVRRDGEVRWVAASGQTTFSANGHRAVVRSVGTMLDVTDSKRSEEMLREADRRKDEFLATLAHELRNPLAPIRTAVQILNVKGSQDADAARMREMIERQVNQLVRLVDDLLDLSRISRGKIELQRARVALADVLQNAVETSGPLVEAGRHRLTVTVPPHPLVVEGDLVRLTQVVANLLNNAAKYTPEGGRIDLALTRDGREAVVRVRDTGLGVPADMIGKVFEMFTQVNRHMDRSQGGLGIGLALVKRLVEMHGGTVAAASEGEGRGAEFVVRLPLAGVSVEEGAQAGGADRVGGFVRRRILVVDDNADAADSLSELLSLRGHEVRTAHDGPTGIGLAVEFGPDVILLDIGMPGMDGYETAKRVRELQECEGVALVALTGWGQEDDRRRTREAGFDHHMVKPVDPAALDALLDSLTHSRAKSG